MSKRKKNSDIEAGVVGCGVIAAIIILFVLSLFLTPLFLMLTWNLAMCALFPAAPMMSYWIAFGINWFLNIIGNKFRTSINTEKIISKFNKD